MAATLRKSLKTIEDYKATNPIYTDLLDILGENPDYSGRNTERI